MDVNFRKIDIDVYDEDVLLETELYDPDPRHPQRVIQDAKAKAASVRTSLAKWANRSYSSLRTYHDHRIRGDILGALVTILGNPPYGPSAEEAKVTINETRDFPPLTLPQNLTLQAVVTVLNSTKSTDIPNVVRSLPPEAQDTLMKYLYKGMGMPGWGDVSGSVLLGWHEKVGSIPDPFVPIFPLTPILVDRNCRNRLYRKSHDRP